MPDPAPRTVPLVDPVSGDFFNVPEADAGYYLQRGWREQTAADVGAAARRGAREADYGGIAGGAKAGLAAVARGATLGGSDVAARALGGDETADTLRNLREEHPALSAGGELVGAVLPAFFSAGESLPASLAARSGRGIAEVAGGGLRGAIAGGAAEGALFGAGQGVSDLALSRDPLTLEHAAAAIGSNALYGAAAGGVAGGAFKGAEIGLGAAKRALDRALIARTEGPAMRALGDLEAGAVAHPSGIGTDVEIEYPGLATDVATEAPLSTADPIRSGPLEIRRVKDSRRVAYEATLPDGTKRTLTERGEVSDLVNAELPPEFQHGAMLETHRDLAIERGLPKDGTPIRDNALYVARPSELADHGIIGGDLTAERGASVAEARKAGTKLDPIEIKVDKEGRYWLDDGNHRLQEAAKTDSPVAIKFTSVPQFEWKGGAFDISQRIRSELPAPPVLPPTPTPAAPVASAPTTARIPLSSLDKKGLDLAEKVERERVIAARQPARDRFVEMLDNAHKAREPDKEWLAIVADRNPDKYTREQAKVVFNVDRRIRNLLDNREGLAARPGRATEWLQQERQALEGLIERGESDLQAYRARAAAAPGTVRKELLAGELPGFKVGKGAISPSSPVIDDIVAREVQARFPRDADGVLIAPKELAGFEDGRLRIALGRNRDLQTMIANLERAPMSDRLSQIEAAREALSGKTAPPKAEPESTALGDVLKVAAHAVPFGGLVEKATGALGGLRKAIGTGTERAARAASTFLGKAAPVAGKAAELAPPVATKVLAALRYGEPEPDERGRRVAKPDPKTLPELYKARTDEIKSQVQLAPDGTYQMTPAARLKMAARLSGLGVVDPIAADRLESAGAARIAWLASQMPRRPDMAGLPVGPDNYQPSDAAMRSWARKAAAAEDPYGVLERASAGAKARVVPEEIMAMRALHPEILNDYITQIITGLPERKQRLPYPQRLSLSMLTGRPLDPAMTPPVLRELQSMFAAEPGTAGGTMAPRPSPQFGSVKRSDPGTPAQRRQGIGV